MIQPKLKSQKKQMSKKISNLMLENPWILEFKGFVSLGFGMPLRNKRVEDELGLVVGVTSEEDVSPMKKLFRKNLGSSTRWEDYPIYFDIVGIITLQSSGTGERKKNNVQQT